MASYIWDSCSQYTGHDSFSCRYEKLSEILSYDMCVSILLLIVHAANIEIRPCVKPVAYQRLKTMENCFKNHHSQKVVTVAYRRWCFTRGSNNCKAIPGNVWLKFG